MIPIYYLYKLIFIIMGSATNQIATINDCKKINSSAFSSITGNAAKECVTYKDINGSSTVSKYLQAGSVSTNSYTTKVVTPTGYYPDPNTGTYTGDVVYMRDAALPTAKYTPTANIVGSVYVTCKCVIDPAGHQFGSYVGVAVQIFIGNYRVWAKSMSWNPMFSEINQSVSYSFSLSDTSTGTIFDNWDSGQHGGKLSASLQIIKGAGMDVTASASIPKFTLQGKQSNTSNQLVKYSDIKSLTSTPTMYKFTISPTPSSATVTITTNGYTQSGNSITVPSGQQVSWVVSKTGYHQQSGSHVVTSNYTKSVTLSAQSGGGGTSTSSSSRLGVWE